MGFRRLAPFGVLLASIPLVFLAARTPEVSHSRGLEAGSLERTEVRNSLERFLTRERGFIQTGLSNAPTYLPVVRKELSRRNLPEDLVFLPLIESGFSVKAHSRAGAVGLWQFMPSTGRMYGLRVDYWVDERRDPFKSTEKAAAHLSDLYEWYRDWELSLAAYNAGRRAVDKAIERGGTRDFWRLCELGLLKRETRDYVPRFYAASHIAKNHEKYGFSFEENGGFPDFELLVAEKPVDLTLLGERSGIPLGALQRLNPELELLITPWGERYNLRVPHGSFARAQAAYHGLPEHVFKDMRRHQVKSGETLGEIAGRYGTDVYLLKRINGIGSDKRLYAGDRIFVPVHGRSPGSDAEAFQPARKEFRTQEIRYTVKRGDTVWSIAKAYDVAVERILSVNGLSFDSVIRPGDEINLWLDLGLTP